VLRRDQGDRLGNLTLVVRGGKAGPHERHDRLEEPPVFSRHRAVVLPKRATSTWISGVTTSMRPTNTRELAVR
jgi:hypothetical protein